jgi:hypothetical protein
MRWKYQSCALEGARPAPELLDRFRPVLERRQSRTRPHSGARPRRWHAFGLSGDELIAEMRRFFAGAF